MSSIKATHMPSKELIEEVKGLKDVSLEKFCTQTTISIRFKEKIELTENGLQTKHSHRKTYNLYEFVSDCKKWAVSKGYTIYSECGTRTALAESFIIRLYDSERVETFWEETEAKSVFKACEWIMKDHKKM